MHLGQHLAFLPLQLTCLRELWVTSHSSSPHWQWSDTFVEHLYWKIWCQNPTGLGISRLLKPFCVRWTLEYIFVQSVDFVPHLLQHSHVRQRCLRGLAGKMIRETQIFYYLIIKINQNMPFEKQQFNLTYWHYLIQARWFSNRSLVCFLSALCL